MLAERLGIAAADRRPQAHRRRRARLTIERQTDERLLRSSTAPLPAVVSAWDTINEPRYPSFKGIMAAKKKPVQTLSLADLGVDAGEVGLAARPAQVRRASPGRPPQAASGVKVTDEGDGGVKLVEFLAAEKFV